MNLGLVEHLGVISTLRYNTPSGGQTKGGGTNTGQNQGCNTGTGLGSQTPSGGGSTDTGSTGGGEDGSPTDFM